MGNRVYVLLDIAPEKAKEVAQVLRESPGVVMADTVEGRPEVIAVVEAAEQERLVKQTIQALTSVETAIENVRFLPTRERLNTATSPKLSPRSKGKNRNHRKRGCETNQRE
jgi:hypothetical protein